MQRELATQQLAAQGAEAPAAPSQQQQMAGEDAWAARREAERRRRQEVAARPDAAKQHREAAKRAAAQAAAVLESPVGAEPAAAEAAATPSAAQTVEEPARQEGAQPAADLCQQGKQGEERGQVAAAASSHAPQLAANASLSLAAAAGGFFRQQRGGTSCSRRPSKLEAQAAVGAASLASQQGRGSEAVAKQHHQTVRHLSLACQLQLGANPCGLGVFQCWMGAFRGRTGPLTASTICMCYMLPHLEQDPQPARLDLAPDSSLRCSPHSPLCCSYLLSTVHASGSAAACLPCRGAQHQADPTGSSGSSGERGQNFPAGAPCCW